MLQTDICIVGAGPAGITIALGLADQRCSVILLEAGGLDPTEEGQAHYFGTMIGRAYPPLDACRIRSFGGTSNSWGGWCAALDSLDFENRPWLRGSGWPFSKKDLEGDYRSAWSVCGQNAALQSDSSDSQRCISGSIFEKVEFRISPIRFGQVYRKHLARAKNVSVILNANVFDIRLKSTNAREVDVLRVATPSKKRFSVGARYFVIAAGGIENARLLLASRNSRSVGVGNEHDLVGRYFCDHLHFFGPTCAIDLSVGSLKTRTGLNGLIRPGIKLTEAIQRKERMLGFAVTGHNPRDPHDVIAPSNVHLGYKSLVQIYRSLAKGALPEKLGTHTRNILRNLADTSKMAAYRVRKPRWMSVVLGCRAEQAPNPESRVLLDDGVDAFGKPFAKLDWRLTSQDLGGLRQAYKLLLCNSPFSDKFIRGAREEIAPVAASHHIGTTRMHADPRLGVVDTDCRVHTVDNLFIAGSSVFPTAGWAPPTLTVLALAIRLTRHLKRLLL